MSVKEKVLGIAKIAPKRGEAEQEFLKRVVAIITEVNDADWKALGQDAQEWFNEAVDALNDNKEVAPFPEEKPAAPARASRTKKEEPVQEEAGSDVVGAEVKVTTARGKEIIGTIVEIDADSMVVKDDEGEEHEFDRTRVKSVEFLNQGGTEESAEPAVGDDVILTTKRGTVAEGKIVEMDDEVVILDTGNGQDTEYVRSRIGSMVVKGGAVSQEPVQEELPIERDPVVGDMVVVVTKRGKEVKGTVVEIDGDTLVVGVSPDGEEIETDMSTAQSITITTPVQEEKPARSARATTKEAPAPTTGRGAKKEAGEKKTKISAKANGGISAPTRMKEIICADPTITKEALAKILKSEKLEYNDNTLLINFKLCNDIIELLKKNKHYK